jgi:NAD(P)-dependent dehydrogenase (short-subunit alcohol dehydrogenase family)
MDLAAGMKLLMLGGTAFLGRHLVEAALGRGHEVTLFNRGRTNARLFPGVERLTGDRDGGLEPLRGRRWDAVVDTSGYVPRVVRQTAELLRDSGAYVFVSSGSVYPLRSQDRSENDGRRLFARENARMWFITWNSSSIDNAMSAGSFGPSLLGSSNLRGILANRSGIPSAMILCTSGAVPDQLPPCCRH